MNDHAVYALMRRRGTEAGIAKFSPHDCRRTFVGDLLENGVDLATVKEMAGHASVQTTARYDRRGETAKRKASGALSVPYVARGLGVPGDIRARRTNLNTLEGMCR